MSRLCVFGSFIIDNIAHVDHFPLDGESLICNDFEVHPGGKGINQAAAASKFGANVMMVGMLGNDAGGKKMFTSVMNENHIKHDNVFSCSKPTGMSQIQIDKTGQNRIVVVPSANHEFDENYMENAKMVVDMCDFFLTQFEMRLGITYELIRYASTRGKTVIVNPAPASKFPNDLLQYIDILTPNETELAILADMDTSTMDGVIAAARKLVKKGVKNLVVTLGDKGCLLMNKDKEEIIETYKVKAIDTVGAGDAFNGALSAALMENVELETAIMYANAMGALSVIDKGAIPSYKDRQDVVKFVEDNGFCNVVSL